MAESGPKVVINLIRTVESIPRMWKDSAVLIEIHTRHQIQPYPNPYPSTIPYGFVYFSSESVSQKPLADIGRV